MLCRYWSPIDEVIREAVILRGVRVQLLISSWSHTHPLTLNFAASLKSLCIELHNCSLEVVRGKFIYFLLFLLFKLYCYLFLFYFILFYLTFILLLFYFLFYF